MGHRTSIKTSYQSGVALQAIPKGLCHLAQGCEGRATLGQPEKSSPTPTGLWQGLACARVCRVKPQPRRGWKISVQFTQGSENGQSGSDLATLGFESESLWDSSAEDG